MFPNPRNRCCRWGLRVGSEPWKSVCEVIHKPPCKTHMLVFWVETDQNWMPTSSSGDSNMHQNATGISRKPVKIVKTVPKMVKETYKTYKQRHMSTFLPPQSFFFDTKILCRKLIPMMNMSILWLAMLLPGLHGWKYLELVQRWQHPRPWGKMCTADRKDGCWRLDWYANSFVHRLCQLWPFESTYAQLSCTHV